MTTIKDTAYAPGDIVCWYAGTTWSRSEQWGRVSRVTTKGTVFVRHRDQESEFRGGRGLRRPSEHEVNHRKWSLNPPKTAMARVRKRLGSEHVSGVAIDVTLESPEALREQELISLAEWLEKEPSDG